MDRRFLLAILICAGLFAAHRIIFPAKPTSQEQNAQSSGNSASGAATGSSAGVSATSVSEQETSVDIVIERPGLYQGALSSQGNMKRFLLQDPKYQINHPSRLEVTKPGAAPEKQTQEGYHPMEMISTYHPSLRFDFPEHSFPWPNEAKFKRSGSPEECMPGPSLGGVMRLQVPDAGCTVVYTLEVPQQVRVQKALRFEPNTYEVRVQLTVTNLSNLSVKYSVMAALTGFQDPEQKSGLFSRRVPQNEIAWDNSGSWNKISLDKLLENSELEQPMGDISTINIVQQYFIQSLAVPLAKQGSGVKKVVAAAEANGALTAKLLFESRTLEPKNPMTHAFSWYAGPKIPERLQAVAVQGVPSGLERSIDYTFAFLARPLLWTLRHIQQFVHNWALSIVLLTLLVKLITLYPTIRSNKSMKAMSDLKPQLDLLQQKYANDKQRLNEEMMKLYRQHGINPLGGCLPMLLQMPIYIALYSMLSNAVELYRVPLISAKWIEDLTAADPYFVLPLLTGGLMFLQTRLSPAPSDPQQKAMIWMMPVMFTVFSIFAPAGLTLYILTNTMLGILQQFVTNRLQKKPKIVAKKGK